MRNKDIYQWFSNCVFGWGRISAPSLNVKRVIFFPISWGEIPNTVVIKLFVKIVNESLFKWHWIQKKFLQPDSNEVADVNKASEIVCVLKWVRSTNGSVFYLIPGIPTYK